MACINIRVLQRNSSYPFFTALRSYRKASGSSWTPRLPFRCSGHCGLCAAFHATAPVVVRVTVFRLGRTLAAMLSAVPITEMALLEDSDVPARFSPILGFDLEFAHVLLVWSFGHFPLLVSTLASNSEVIRKCFSILWNYFHFYQFLQLKNLRGHVLTVLTPPASGFKLRIFRAMSWSCHVCVMPEAPPLAQSGWQHCKILKRYWNVAYEIVGITRTHWYVGMHQPTEMLIYIYIMCACAC